MRIVLAMFLAVSAAAQFPVERELRGGEKHEYSIRLGAGEYAHVIVEQRGIDVVVAAFAPDGTKIAEVDSPNGANGPEPVSIAAARAGAYRIEVRSFDAKAQPGRYEVRIAERLTRTQYRRRLADERARDEAVIAWMRQRAIPLRSVEPGSGFDDLRPLRDVLAGVRVVGLGEATHGSHELFTLKHRLIEFLVTQMDFTLLAIEGSVETTRIVNDYIHGGGDRDAALAAIRSGGWIQDTQEFAALVEWLRAHNAVQPVARRVRLAGLDPQINTGAIDFLGAYLVRLAPQRAEELRPLFEAMRVQDSNSIEFARTEVSAEMLQGLHRLVAFLVLNEGDFVLRSSAAEHRRAVESATQLAQFGEFNSPLPPAQVGSRDGYMADHFFRALAAAPAGTRAVVWAHNSHIAARQSGSFPPTGGFLRKAFGAEYYALAQSFERGAFQAQLPNVRPPDLREFRLPAAAAGTLDWFLGRANAGPAIVDLRANPPSDARIAEWLQAPRRMYWVGAIFSPEWTESQWVQSFVLSRDFDGIAFVKSTTRARPR
ncbi:MAG TPA: erythromycin esterase family protein [Thermoanaerobaculia bacterium]|nr:erythromycin esterase family protein [Thermoanaerobaculia bacterium]